MQNTQRKRHTQHAQYNTYLQYMQDISSMHDHNIHKVKKYKRSTCVIAENAKRLPLHSFDLHGLHRMSTIHALYCTLYMSRTYIHTYIYVHTLRYLRRITLYHATLTLHYIALQYAYIRCIHLMGTPTKYRWIHVTHDWHSMPCVSHIPQIMVTLYVPAISNK